MLRLHSQLTARAFMQRVPSIELLDQDAGTAAEIEASLRDLERINAWFGGIWTTQKMMERVARSSGTRSLSLLEVAAGSGDVPAAASERLQRLGIQVKFVLLDRSSVHLDSRGPAVVGDALRLPFPDSSFDVVSCGLFAHHMAPDAFVQFVKEALRVCRTAVLINDLIRHPLHLLLIYAGLPLFRSHITRHDSIASVKQAYTVEEMRNMLSESSASRIEITRHYLFRMGAIAWKS